MKLSNLMNGAQRLALVVAVLVMVSGCSWFRSKNAYQSSTESRPLEVPPELSTPTTDPSMAIPAVSATRSSPTSVTPPAAASTAFQIADSADSAYKRVGLALDRLSGLVVVDRAQALSAYNVRFEGEEFLIRVVADGQASRVEAVNAAGSVLDSGAATKVLGMLKARLG